MDKWKETACQHYIVGLYFDRPMQARQRAAPRAIAILNLSVRPSVGLSVTFQSCAKRLKIALWSVRRANKKPILHYRRGPVLTP